MTPSKLDKAIELAKESVQWEGDVEFSECRDLQLSQALLHLSQAVEEAEKIIKDCNMCAEWQRTHMDCADWLEKYGGRG